MTVPVYFGNFPQSRSRGGDGVDGTGGGGMEINERVAKLETAIESLATKADLQTELSAVRVSISDTRLEIEKSANRVIMAFIAIAVALGLVQRFLVPAPAQPQLQPIVVQVPAQAAPITPEPQKK